MAHLGFDKNEYGTRISKHKCDVCGENFTLCPAQEKDDTCGHPECASYDINRDANFLFMSDAEIKKQKTVSLNMFKARQLVFIKSAAQGESE